MAKILLAEDHTLVRQSLIKTINGEEGMHVVGETGRGDEVVELAKRMRPDVVVLDIALPGEDGLEVAAKLKRDYPDMRVMFLTMHDDDASIRRAIDLGADGFVHKSASTDEMISAVRAVSGGDSYISPSIARRVMDLAGGKRTHSLGELTDRELDILRLISEGSRPQEVADKLFLSIKTVKNHLTNIYSKLGVGSAAQAVAEAYRRGLVSSQSPRRE